MAVAFWFLNYLYNLHCIVILLLSQNTCENYAVYDLILKELSVKDKEIRKKLLKVP